MIEKFHRGSLSLDDLRTICSDYQSTAPRKRLIHLKAAITTQPIDGETKINRGQYVERIEGEKAQRLRFVEFRSIGENNQARAQAIADGFSELFVEKVHVDGSVLKVIAFGRVPS